MTVPNNQDVERQIIVSARIRRRRGQKLKRLLSRAVWPFRLYFAETGDRIDIYNHNIPVATIQITMGLSGAFDRYILCWGRRNTSKKPKSRRANLSGLTYGQVTPGRLVFQTCLNGLPDIDVLIRMIKSELQPTTRSSIISLDSVPFLQHRRVPEYPAVLRSHVLTGGKWVPRTREMNGIRTTETAIAYLTRNGLTTAEAIECSQDIVAGADTTFFREKFYRAGGSFQIWLQICSVIRLRRQNGSVN